MSEQQKFEDYLGNTLSSIKEGFDPGEKVIGEVVDITNNEVFVDINYTSDGIIKADEFPKEDFEKLSIGDKVTAYYVGYVNGETILSVKMTGSVTNAELQNAYDAGIPVEGKVTEERKGGYGVTVAGEKGFCPYSQIDIRRQDPENYVGKTFTFKISEYKGNNLVVSRRKLLEAEQQKKLEEIKDFIREGDLASGIITKVMDFGAFVEVSGAFEGLIPISELAWWHVEDPTEIVKEGDKVKVKVLKIDWEKDRHSFSLRETMPSPWDYLEERYQEGKKYSGKVTKLMPFGAFVELEKGLEGLVHISKLGTGRRINHPKEVLKEGEQIEFFIDSINTEDKRISLSMEGLAGLVGVEGDAEDLPEGFDPNAEVCVDAEIAGIVDGIKVFGVFVKVNSEQSGLLHISKINLEKASSNPYRALSDNFKIGSLVNVVVEKIEDGKISLTLKETLEKEADMKKNARDYKDSNANGLGNLGGLFDGIDL
ncbi:MAG: S1 RNA-binding domain-containing protein [Verrucomicrobiota bacterium]|nr:S1 RNA-binding domain-containing protein [Verrucomicrobiota bacterium]